DGLLGGGRGAAVVALGVPLAVGDLLQVAVDVAGVGLGLGAGGDLLARVLDQVVAALRAEALLVGEEDPLRRQLVPDVVVREVGAPAPPAAGRGDRHHGGDTAAAQQLAERARGAADRRRRRHLGVGP